MFIMRTTDFEKNKKINEIIDIKVSGNTKNSRQEPILNYLQFIETLTFK